MQHDDAAELISAHLDLLRPGGQVILITPQEAGFRSDQTHVEFVDCAGLEQLLVHVGCAEFRCFSFPFPRVFGKLFRYNEFVGIGRR